MRMAMALASPPARARRALSAQGWSATSRSANRSELIILIRPTVLPNPQDAAIAASKLKASMPLTRAAEVELQTDWEKYQKIADEVEAKAARRKDGSSKYSWETNAMQFDGLTNSTPVIAPQSK